MFWHTKFVYFPTRNCGRFWHKIRCTKYKNRVIMLTSTTELNFVSTLISDVEFHPNVHVDIVTCLLYFIFIKFHIKLDLRVVSTKWRILNVNKIGDVCIDCVSTVVTRVLTHFAEKRHNLDKLFTNLDFGWLKTCVNWCTCSQSGSWKEEDDIFTVKFVYKGFKRDQVAKLTIKLY